MYPEYDYDVAIIGSGIGGLTAACLLQKCGLKVAVVEKEPRGGGYLSGYERKGYRFDTAIHWLNQCSENGLVTKIFKLIGSDYPSCKTYKNIQRYKGQTTDFLLTNNPDQLKSELIAAFPADEEGIKKFFQSSKKIGRALNNFKKFFRTGETMTLAEKAGQGMQMLQFALPFIPFISYTDKKMRKGLSRYFKDERLHQLFSAETDLLSCMVPIGWAYYQDYQYPPEGGGQVIPEWMMHYLRQQGCNLFFNAAVKKIIVSNKTAAGVLINQKGEEKILHARYVIAACDLDQVYKKLLPDGLIPAKTLAKLDAAEMYASSLTVSIALDCPTEQLGFGEEMVHLFKEDIAKDLHNSGDPEHSALTILAPTVCDKTLAPDGCGTLVIFMPAYMNQYENWQTGPKFERGNEYTELKNNIAEKLISRIEQALAPQLRRHIVFYEVATPVTHWRYTANKNGTMMGTKPGKKNMQSKVAGYTTPVKNLFIGGQWAELGGGVPIAAKAGTNAALLVLKKENRIAFKELVDYFDGRKNAALVNSSGLFKPYNNSWKRRKTTAEKYFRSV